MLQEVTDAQQTIRHTIHQDKGGFVTQICVTLQCLPFFLAKIVMTK